MFRIISLNNFKNSWPSASNFPSFRTFFSHKIFRNKIVSKNYLNMKKKFTKTATEYRQEIEVAITTRTSMLRVPCLIALQAWMQKYRPPMNCNNKKEKNMNRYVGQHDFRTRVNWEYIITYIFAKKINSRFLFFWLDSHCL